ncbi:MAG: hypothetical protein IJJ22_01180, partial [Oscillospiraceae bacterium]|nr:hypothetical protein [Oscillospiraceae bacterium]
MDNGKKLKQLKKILEEADAYGRCIGKVDFDMQCCAPPDGMEKAGEDMAVLGRQIHKLTHSKKYVQLVKDLHENGEGLTPVQKKTVEHLYEDWQKTSNQSPRFA